MKKLMLSMLCLAAVSATAQTVYREGYVRKDGTYVAPSYATSPNSTKLDNYGTKGNYNPYTGKAGTVDPYKVPQYEAPKTYELPKQHKGW